MIPMWIAGYPVIGVHGVLVVFIGSCGADDFMHYTTLN